MQQLPHLESFVAGFLLLRWCNFIAGGSKPSQSSMGNDRIHYSHRDVWREGLLY